MALLMVREARVTSAGRRTRLLLESLHRWLPTPSYANGSYRDHRVSGRPLKIDEARLVTLLGRWVPAPRQPNPVGAGVSRSGGMNAHDRLRRRRKGDGHG